MEEDDLLEVHAIERVSFPNPWHLSTFRGEIHNRPISSPYVFVHRLEKRIIGYIIYWQIKDEIQISNLAVHPDFRRMGVGESALRQVLSRLEKGGAKFISLEVRPSNTAAIKLYHKLDFDILGFRKNYYHNPPEDAIVMAKYLNQ
jgi:ribosomal-protein-alanine N-acetyltransferase